MESLHVNVNKAPATRLLVFSSLSNHISTYTRSLLSGEFRWALPNTISSRFSASSQFPKQLAPQDNSASQKDSTFQEQNITQVRVKAYFWKLNWLTNPSLQVTLNPSQSSSPPSSPQVPFNPSQSSSLPLIPEVSIRSAQALPALPADPVILHFLT